MPVRTWLCTNMQNYLRVWAIEGAGNLESSDLNYLNRQFRNIVTLLIGDLEAMLLDCLCTTAASLT